MGFSLKPPKWLRNLISGGADAANQAQAATQAVAANYPPAGPSATYSMESMPSWVMPVGIGLAAYLLLNRKG